MLTALTQQLVSKDFHKELIGRMKSLGLLHMYTHQIDTNQHPYHVNMFEFARHSTFYFYLPEDAFIIHLTLVEQIDESVYQSYWSARVDVHFDQTRVIEHEVRTRYDSDGVSGIWDDEPGESVLNFTPPFGPFRHSNSSAHYDHFQWSMEHVDPETARALPLVEVEVATRQLLDHCRPFLRPQFELSHGLQVTGYPPRYCFPRCEQNFWQHFPKHLLKERIKNGRIFGF